MEYSNQFLTGDASVVLKQLPNESVDFTCTSPPYDLMRQYKGKVDGKKIFKGGYSFPFEEIADELYRVTKEGGVVMWNVADQVIDGGESGTSFRMALYFQSIGFLIYDTMLYGKNSPNFPEMGRYGQVFEYCFILSKGKPKTFNQIRDKKNKWAGHSNFGKPSSRQADGSLKQHESFTVADYGARYNIWYIANGKGYTTKDEIAYQHPALMPEELAEGMILSWTKPGDIVLDPMSGGGTTAKMAYINNRNYIGIDLQDEYNDIARERIKLATPYTEENPNPLDKFIVTREELMEKRRQTREANKKKKAEQNG
jgi:site-specific DNA-methyltransferase (adenine-specific)